MPVNKKTTELPRVLTTKPVSKISNIPRILPTKPVSKISNIPRILPTIPVTMGKSGVRPQTPYDDKTSQPYKNIRPATPYDKTSRPYTNIRPATPYDKTSRPYTNIRPETPYPIKEETRPEFSSNLQNERTQDLTYFLNEINKHGGKYSKKKVVKKSKRVVKANKK